MQIDLLFYFMVNKLSVSWQVGQITSPWGSADGFGIGYRAYK